MRQASIRSIIGASQQDFFGIRAITSKDIAGSFNSNKKLAQTQLSVKYKPLSINRNKLDNEETRTDIQFGVVRYDVENVVQKHGQFEENMNAEKVYDTIKIKQMFTSDESEKTPSQLADQHEQNPSPGHEAYRISEVQAIKDLSEALEILGRGEDEADALLKYANAPPLTFYFKCAPTQNERLSPIALLESTSHSKNSKHETTSNMKNKDESEERENETKHDDVYFPQRYYDTLAEAGGIIDHPEDNNSINEDYDDDQERQAKVFEATNFKIKLDEKYAPKKSESKSPLLAIDYIEEVRAKRADPIDKKLKQHLQSTNPYPLRPSIKLDSQGFRNYTFQVPDWRTIRRVDVLDHLKQSIIYHNHDIIALNKPYGISSHRNPQFKDEYDINTLMKEIAKSMRIEKIHLIHRLDKTTTGILLFATCCEVAQKLNRLFKTGDVKKTYWCITKGVPDPRRGLIDIPIDQMEVAGKLRSCPAPISLDGKQQLVKRYREARRAISEYSVVSNVGGAALVEVKPQTGIKHQIRCHLGFGLKTPILGDHKYSSIGRIAPQKLSSKLLKDLHVRPSKVRTLPIHLHAKTIVIPGVKPTGGTLFINAPLPEYFLDNMKSLGIRNPNQSGS